MFLMAMVPFHHWFIAFISEGVLPVCGIITLIPPLIYICTLINLIHECFSPFNEFLSPILTGFATLTLIIGALSANLENNIRRLFAFVYIYCLGYTLIAMNDFSDRSIISAFAYIIVIILSFSGIYTVFLSMKSKVFSLRFGIEAESSILKYNGKTKYPEKLSAISPIKGATFIIHELSSYLRVDVGPAKCTAE